MAKKHDKKPIDNTELIAKINELEVGWKRTQADFDNFRNRTEQQREEILDFQKADFMTKIAPVLDNFHRAFEHAPEGEFATGIKQIEKQLEEILTSEGLKRIDTTGEFNPNLHEAISSEANKDVPADYIIAEVESGWQFKDRVIRPAKVRVSKGK